MDRTEFQARVRQTLDQLRRELIADRGGAPHWTGRLSASALSTATAISALSVACRSRGAATSGEPCGSDRVAPRAEPEGDISPSLDTAPQDNDRYLMLVRRGCEWLLGQQNADGGFGDTDLSHSNIATSYLVLAARTLAADLLEDLAADPRLSASQESLRAYLETAGGIPALRERYGTDKTFVVPILNNLAVAGLVPWSDVAALPFEAAVFPQSMYRFLGMPVVSYAVPALVAIGQAKFCRSGCLPPWSWVRRSAIEPSLKVLEKMQPGSGGYLEATPLTAFVVMSLVDTLSTSPQPNGARDRIIEQGLRFLQESVDEEGSWPIDTNLATWVTSLSVAALASDPADQRDWSSDAMIDWLLSCQHTRRHPFTGADPGGWGWTDLSGAVPDADDTPGAIVALGKLRDVAGAQRLARIDAACADAKEWLLGLQNRDGGWPTFCRGWGKLPFDRSSTDLTAHALRAMATMPTCPRSETATRKGLRFLRAAQQPDGSWLPLWFGNQDRPAEDNPVYGTAKVLVDAPAELGVDCISQGIAYLLGSQNADGGWGGGDSVARLHHAGGLRSSGGPPNGGGERGGVTTSTVEETALAIESLASLWGSISGPEFSESSGFASQSPSLTASTRDAILAGSEWLVRAVAAEQHRIAWPIGFYFAKLWYHERLYPLIFTTAALGRVATLPFVSGADHDDTP
ncbi:prenyltransferase/squalene oxidase repeat-containing protein [Allorhodopirellula solitaria]|uniref:Sporulenol synthase n=1 Tax=Allorhodopirellula solitaria TaxID=2527987 RepID=A0A5C5XVB6_9BACT|nr:prenyltransferase/squalene oxidase repeat-containing protein [Allorhodopirellula solitaria]TWT67247.1 Sporulenol synthase [Allorhodopirellula solitaria]